AGLVYLYLRDTDSGHFYPPSERKAITEMTLPRLDGSQWRLSEHKGNVVLLNFWATWCQPCLREIPALVELSRQYAAAGLVVAGIAMDEDGVASVEKFVQRHGISYAILLPSGQTRLSLSATLQGLPTTVLLDRQLRIAKTYTGAFSKAVFSKDIASLLKEPPGHP
ncbi:MAG: TlpA disulfide reductase family protein, partial [Acidobacteria bacterium]|nr:TlpA disulfide reductase family protein [Acidobacteriota bacterium]